MNTEGSADRRCRRAGRLVVVAVGCAVLVAWAVGPGGVHPGEPVAGAEDAPSLLVAAPSRPRARDESRAGAGPRRVRRKARDAPAPGTPVLGALERARTTGAIGRGAYRAHRRVLRRARALVRRLAGTPRTEMAASVAMVDDLAARRLLTAARMRAAFLTLRRNAQVWRRGTVPAAGERFAFGHDPAVFQYFPGRGLAFHPLGSFGRVNARARICLERLVERRSGRERCRPRSLRRALDRLAGLAVRRDGFTAWEYLVPFGGGTPPWISAMSQAVAIQVLARAAKALHVRRWRSIAEDALGAFEHPAPTGVRVAIPGGTYYAMYPFAPTLRILNGSLQSLLGLYDHATLSGSARARRLFRAAEPTAREAVIAHDTGSWSLYSRYGVPSPLNYHRLVVKQLAALCRRLDEATYCDARRRFARYERTPPAIDLVWDTRSRVGDPAPVVFSMSQAASIRLQVRRGGRTVLARRMRVGPGRHVVAWTARRMGRHRLILRALGREGSSIRSATLTVTQRRPPGEARGGRRRDGARGKRRPDPTAPAHATPAPAATPAPRATSTPDATATPEPETRPDASVTPQPAKTPDSSPTPALRAPPEPTATPEPATTPDFTATPEAGATPAAGATPMT